MSPVDMIIIALVVVLFVLAARRAVGTFTGKRDCCSGDTTSSSKDFPRAHISDTDEAHYPYTADYTVSGMSCEHCVQRVTNALDSVPGTWAKVDLNNKSAHILSKEPIDEAAYRKVVREAGYKLA